VSARFARSTSSRAKRAAASIASVRSLASIGKDLRLFAKYHLKHPVASHPAREEELGLVELPLDLERYVRELEAFSGFSSMRAAEVKYEGASHPILVLRSEGEAKKTLLVIAGIHGNERAGLLAVPRILARFNAALGVRLVVITPANPIGARELSRYNALGYDINRDFKRFETEEARVIRSAYERERPDFVVSLHEGPHEATFMFANHLVSARVTDAALAALTDGGTKLAARDYFGFRLDPPGLSAWTRMSRLVHELWAIAPGLKPTIQYSAERSIPEIVLESSWRDADAEVRVQPHVRVVESVLAALAES
jgi:hypothetical protein